MKKIIQFLFLTCLSLTLTGCSLTGLDIRSLISPPKANEDQQYIHRLMQPSDGELSFVFPKSGNYRSAVIMKDLDGDLQDEAIGFCENPDGGINFLVMKKAEDKWSIVNKFLNSGTLVNRVCFGDLDGDGFDEIIIGWGAPQSLTATISVFKYGSEETTEYPLDHTYNEFTIADFDGDGTSELFTATVYIPSEDEEGVDQNAVARIFCFDEKPILKYSCLLNNAVSNYNSASFVNIEKDLNAIVLESTLVEGGTITQLLTLNHSTLSSPLSSELNITSYNYFLRPAGFTLNSQDIDGDGIFEFPKVTVQNAVSDDTSTTTVYYVDWLKLHGKNLSEELVTKTVMCTADNFTFEYDESKQITCYQVDRKTYSVNEKIANDKGEYTSEKKIITVKIFTLEEWTEQINGTPYKKIYQIQDKVCAVLDETGDNNNIINTFKAISE